MAKTLKGPRGSKVLRTITARERDVEDVAGDELLAKRDVAKKRKAAAAERSCDSGFNAAGEVTNNKDMQYIDDWLGARPLMIAFVCSLMRNGMIERSYHAQGVSAVVMPTTLGKRWITQANAKLRSLSGSICVMILSRLLPDVNVADWFNCGDERLPMEVAQKAVRYMLGVTAGSSFPKNHKHAAFSEPLVWLFARRWDCLGKRPQTTGKATIDQDSDYFYISDCGTTVIFSLTPSVPVECPIDLKIATDCAISDTEDYAAAKLISDSMGFEASLARMYEKKNAEIAFPEDATLASMGLDWNATAASSTPPSDASADTRVTAALLVSPVKT